MNPNLDDVLYEFALAQDMPDARLLTEFLERFPQYREELVEFAIELAIDVALYPPDPREGSGQREAP